MRRGRAPYSDTMAMGFMLYVINLATEDRSLCTVYGSYQQSRLVSFGHCVFGGTTVRCVWLSALVRKINRLRLSVKCIQRVFSLRQSHLF